MALVAHQTVFHWHSFDTLGVCMRLIVSVVFSLEKNGKKWKNWPFFRVATAGLGKYSMGGYGRIGV